MILVAFMYFWSISWSNNCPVYFSSFFGRPKKNCPVSETGQKNFGQSLNFFWSVSDFFVHLLLEKLTKKKFRDWPNFFCPVSETGQFFFGWPKKWEIDQRIGRPKDLPKVHGRRFCLPHFPWKFKSWAGKILKIWGSNPRSGRSKCFCHFFFSNSSHKNGYLWF